MWNDQQVLLHLVGTPSTVEITTPIGSSILGVKGMVVSFDNTTPTGSSVWMWNDQQVLLHVVGTPSTVEITDPNGNSILDVKGMVVSPDRTTPTGSSVWMWNGQKVLLHVVGTPSTVEITNPSRGSIPKVRGMIVSLDATTPTGSSVWMWNDQGVFLHVVGTPRTMEITVPSGNVIDNTWAIVTSPDATSPTRSSVWLRNNTRVLLHVVGTPSTMEITAPNKDPIFTPFFDAPSSSIVVVKNVNGHNGGAGVVHPPSPFSVSFVGAGLSGSVDVPTAAPTSSGLTSVIAGNGIQIIRNSTTGSALINNHVAVLLVEDPTPTIQSAGGGDWSAPATWNLNRAPNRNDIVLIQAGHTVRAPAFKVRVQMLYNDGVLESKSSESLNIRATEAIVNYGQILGQPGASNTRGKSGNSISLRGNYIYNGGEILAGGGGGGRQRGGKGGSVFVHGLDITNTGIICAGKGGDVTSASGSGPAGNGGNALVLGERELVNVGLICSGDGGDAYPSAPPSQKGGKGGWLRLFSRRLILGGGEQYAGRDGRDGTVVIEPNIISLAGPDTQVGGRAITIFGGPDWILDLSNMNNATITATGNITLAVGPGGAIDLRGNTEPVLHAGGQVIIASDVISLDTGITLTDVLGPNFVVGPSQILHDAALVGPEQVAMGPGVTLPITLTLLNGGPMTDTYALERFDSAGWDLGVLATPITLAGLDLSDLTLTITSPSGTMYEGTNVITVTATSLADPGLKVVEEIKVHVESPSTVYLPVILR
jgi:hypothetical protein